LGETFTDRDPPGMKMTVRTGLTMDEDVLKIARQRALEKNRPPQEANISLKTAKTSV
jgi:hypothetical protein